MLIQSIEETGGLFENYENWRVITIPSSQFKFLRRDEFVIPLGSATPLLYFRGGIKRNRKCPSTRAPSANTSRYENSRFCDFLSNRARICISWRVLNNKRVEFDREQRYAVGLVRKKTASRISRRIFIRASARQSCELSKLHEDALNRACCACYVYNNDSLGTA